MKKLLLLALFCLVGSGVYAQKNFHNGHEWVDLGLPSGLKWATCNLGASSPEEYGDYFAWGETSPKEYNYGECASWDQSWSDIGGNSSRDAATANWGGDWRMPTKEDFEELREHCTWEWTTQNGHYGFKVTGPNGNSILLPAEGRRYGADEYEVGLRGHYWSSTPDESDTRYACILCLRVGYHLLGVTGRISGLSVRPVLE